MQASLQLEAADTQVFIYSLSFSSWVRFAFRTLRFLKAQERLILVEEDQDREHLN